MSVAYRSTCGPTLGRCVDRDVSVNMTTDTSRATLRLRVGQYVDRHIGRASVDMLTDISVEMSTDIPVEGFVNYT